MKVIEGDLLRLAREGKFDAIVHGCNCYCTFGAGIAAQIRRQFPAAYAADCKTEAGDFNKLGNFTSATISEINSFIIINAYTQGQFGQGKQANYDAIDQVFERIAKTFTPKARIGYPAIGCGLAGGHWPVVREIIDHRLKNHDHTFVIYKP